MNEARRKDNLTPRQAEAAELRAAGYTRSEIAQRRGVTPQAIKKLWSRARQRIVQAATLQRYAAALSVGGARIRMRPLSLSFIENV